MTEHVLDTLSVAPAAPRFGARRWALVALLVGVVGGGGYWWAGTPALLGLGATPADAAPPGFGPAAEGGEGDAKSHEMSTQQIEGLVQQLAERMQQQPDDAQGWAMLGRSYMAMGRPADAMGAYERALKLLGEDATTLADYADAMAVKNGRTLEGEPSALIARALKADPDNAKALVLAGTAAFNRDDYAGAVKHWDRAVQMGPADSGMVQMARAGAAEARERGKLPPAAPTAAATSPATVPTTPPTQGNTATALAAPATPGATGAAATSVSGTVRLAPALKAAAAPDDTVFIFARAAQGSRMPLAIVRMQVRDLPAKFTLDDSQAMSPATRLSGAAQVVVGARISKAGQAMPQPGDLEGLSAPLAVGTQGIALEINQRLP